MIWIEGDIISRNSCIITCRWATLGSLTKWMMLHREGIWIIFEAESPWLHVGVCRRVLSPQTLPRFWRCESCHRGSSRSCKWDSNFPTLHLQAWNIFWYGCTTAVWELWTWSWKNQSHEMDRNKACCTMQNSRIGKPKSHYFCRIKKEEVAEKAQEDHELLIAWSACGRYACKRTSLSGHESTLLCRYDLLSQDSDSTTALYIYRKL